MEVLIERMGAGGDGIAPGPTYVPQGLPGERLHVEINGKRGDGALAAIHEILTPSLDRIAPACAHFLEGCGGCALQHWAPTPQAAWKRERLRVALARGGFAEAPVAETITTPPGARRRADFAIRRGTDGLRLGFHAAGSAAILDIAACPVLHPRLVAVLKPLRDLLPRLPALKRDGSAVLNLLDTGPDLLLRTDGTLDAAGRALLAGFAEFARERPGAEAVVLYPSDEILAVLRAANPPQNVRCRRMGGAVAASAVLTSSGTMSMHCALAGIPGAIAYRANWLTYLLGKMLVKIEYLGIANLLLEEPMYPEFIQGAARADALAAQLRACVHDPARTQRTAEQAGRLRELLNVPASGTAAEWLARMIP
jgi:hypothetical protein